MKTSSSLAAAAYLLLFSPSLSLAQSCTVTSNTKITFFGWPDNGPPAGPDNAFDCGRGNGPDGQPIAGGTGSYDDPISLATATNNKNLPKCGIVYIPQLRKYFRNEDDCEQCNTDWTNGGQYHVDLWTGSNQQDDGSALTNCENSLNAGSVIVASHGHDVKSIIGRNHGRLHLGGSLYRYVPLADHEAFKAVLG
ncbi:MAG: hypothetical protein OHK93_005426 [Ramalina farinacea]|uniref:Uncharacterized protein n=1 Tax=Ramalina farinacea TaxID=258253 RepID=A0AA43QKX4_9LECA|nr:hypothetical protein [Ramalina farinacea]